MAETAFPSFVIPGTFIRVQSEGLIGVGGVSTGNIGIVGTIDPSANPPRGPEETHVISAYAEAVAEYGAYDEFGGHSVANLMRGVELAYRNGAGIVYARALPGGDNPHTSPVETGPGQAAYTAAFEELLKEDVNILVAPELSTDDALSVLGPIVSSAEDQGKDVIAVVGADAADVSGIKDQVVASPRIILVAPGIMAYDAAAGVQVALPANYAAAAVAGLLASLPPQSSPTNKVLPGVTRLARRFSYGETKDLVSNRVMVLEQRQGVRVVRGVTTDDGAFAQVTTRRIVDFAKAGIRKAGNPFIGRLNNQRVRGALQGAIDGFLTTMVQNEALIAYRLEVTASRQDEINGRVLVNAYIQPVFSIDYIAVTLVLE